MLKIVPKQILWVWHHNSIYVNAESFDISFRSARTGSKGVSWLLVRLSLLLPLLAPASPLAARGTNPSTWFHGWRGQTTGEYSNRLPRRQHYYTWYLRYTGTAAITATDLMVVPGPQVCPVVNHAMSFFLGHLLPIVAGAASLPWTLHWCRDQDLRDIGMKKIGSLYLSLIASTPLRMDKSYFLARHNG